MLSMDISRKIGIFRGSERGIRVPTELIPDSTRLFFDMSGFPTFALKKHLPCPQSYEFHLYSYSTFFFSALYSTVLSIAELAAPGQIGYPASQISP